ncbi:pimeloyl-ACP methyl ester carboxylesterase [Oxalobacteraceae bacterium GrIS 1.11]
MRPLHSTATAFTRADIQFDAGGVTLRGWLYRPIGPVSAPGAPTPGAPTPGATIVMAGGFGTSKEMYTDRYAEKFAAAGFIVLLYDQRGFGASDGEPRHEIDPWLQVEDLRHALTCAHGLVQVDPARVGVWGSSYSGGHALVVAATDHRVSCVVAQVPTISGSRTARRRIGGAADQALLARFADDRQRRANGADPARLPLAGDAASGALYQSPDALDWYAGACRLAGHAMPVITLRSVELARAYDPGDYIARISPTPLLMQVAQHDQITPTDLALRAYRDALEPKALQLIDGAGHFDVYIRDVEAVSDAALRWFERHLRKP